jgi:DNA polymerase sigma
MRTLLLSAFCDAVIHVLGSFSSSLLLQNLLMAFIVLIAAVAYLDSLYQTCQQLLSSPSQFQVFIISRGLLLLFGVLCHNQQCFCICSFVFF